jgi:hypothetical protein
VRAESAEVARVESALQMLDSAQARRVREKLRRYVERVIENEWPRLAKGLPDGEANVFMRRLHFSILDLESNGSTERHIVEEVRESVERLRELRVQRILSAEAKSLEFFWLLGFVGFTALLIQFGYFERSRPGDFIIAVFCIMQATVFYVALMTSNPFARPGAISPALFEHAIDLRERGEE